MNENKNFNARLTIFVHVIYEGKEWLLLQNDLLQNNSKTTKRRWKPTKKNSLRANLNISAFWLPEPILAHNLSELVDRLHLQKKSNSGAM